MRTLK